MSVNSRALTVFTALYLTFQMKKYFLLHHLTFRLCCSLIAFESVHAAELMCLACLILLKRQIVFLRRR